MIKLIYTFLLLVFFKLGYCQKDKFCCTVITNINGITDSGDSIVSMIQEALKQKKIKAVGDDFKYVRLQNISGSEILKVYSSPGNGYGFYYAVEQSRSSKESNNCIKLQMEKFYTNDSLKIGMTEREVLSRISGNHFRKFIHKKVMYYVLEEGFYAGEFKDSPATIVFLKFKDSKLFSFGLGFGVPLFNPVFPP